MAPPVFNTPPVLDGDTIVGGSVLCLFSQGGASLPTQYAWSNGVTESTGILNLVESDVGEMITCTVTLSNAEGSVDATTDPWGPITEAPPPPPLVTWPATADDVAALLRARTQDDADIEVGEWTEDTRPTLEEVNHLLAMAQSIVLGQTGPLNDETLICASKDDIYTQAATVVALLAAMLVELSYFPEQVQSTRSAYEQYRELFWGADGRSGMIGELVSSVAECKSGGVEPEGGVGRPSFGFPVDRGGLVGWQTRW